MSQPIEALEQTFGDKVENVEVSNYPTVRVAPENLVEVMRFLKDEQGMDYLAGLCSADHPDENVFEVVYFVHCLTDGAKKIQVKVRTPHNKPEVPSITSVYAGADWQEREEYDLMGVTFTGHPNLVRVLLPDDFAGHPLRKDFKAVKLC